MSQSAHATEVLVWTDQSRAGLCGRVMALLDGARAIAVGGPRKSEVLELAEQLGAEAYDDVKRMFAAKPAEHLLVATATGLRLDDLRSAIDDGVHLLTVDPLAESIDQVLIADTKRDGAGRLVQVPLLRHAPGWRAAADPQEAMGKIRAINFTGLGDRSTGSLYARLADAMDMAVHLLGPPDVVDAQLISAVGGVPEDLSGLAGSMTCNLRYGDTAGVSVCVSDASGLWQRGVSVVAEQAVLTAGDGGYRLVGRDGAVLDGCVSSEIEPGALIAEQWRWVMGHRFDRDTVDRRVVIACCQAALLSCRTGQSEDPHRLLSIGM